MILLKQSTSVVIPFGPFLAPNDGVSLVTTLVSALDHASTGIFLNKNGGAGTIRHATVTATTYDAYGNYLVTLDTTDTDTLGRLRVGFAAAASCLPVWQDFMVVSANVYDSLVGASANLKVDLDTIKTQAITCAAGVTVLASVGTAATSTAQTGDSYARIGAPAGASISADIAAKPSASTISAAVVDQTLSGHTTTGTVGAGINAAGAAGDPWSTLLPGSYGSGTAGKIVGDNIDATISSRLASASYTSVSADVTAIKAKTDNLPASPAAVGDIPTANANADALLDRSAGVETSRTLRQALRLMLAALTGKVSGAATATVVIRDTNDSKNRITATVDGNGNRSAVTYDAS